jgi:hypothetical protein
MLRMRIITILWLVNSIKDNFSVGSGQLRWDAKSWIRVADHDKN